MSGLNRRTPTAGEVRARWGTRLLGVLVLSSLAGVIFAAWWLLQPTHLPIREVHISGDFKYLSAAHLQEVIATQATGGFFTVDVSRIRRAVKEDAWVKDVQVSRVWPDTLQVRVLERQAVARWGERGLLSADGEIFYPPLTAVRARPAGLAQLYGAAENAAEVWARYQELQTWFAPLNLRVTAVEISARRSWRFQLHNGINITVGRDAFQARVQRLLAGWAQTVATQPQPVVAVDLRYTNGFALLLQTPSPRGSAATPASGPVIDDGEGA